MDHQPAPTEHDLRLPRGRRMPAAQLVWRANTSGGPGGQHANRTASRAEVTIRIDELPIEPRERALVYERLASRITGAGEITVGASDHRDHHRNRSTALRRLERLLADALHQDKRRVKTRAPLGARLRARASNQRHSQRKSSRGWRPGEQDVD